MYEQVVGKLSDVIVARLGRGDDLLASITEIAEKNGIQTGVVMSITGAVEKVKMQHFHDGVVEVKELSGPLEVSGHGILGRVKAPQYGDQSVGVHPIFDGGPYVHVHVTASSQTETLCGHLMPGTTIWSGLHPISHFTIMIAPIEGAALYMAADGSPDDPEGGFGLHHQVEAL